MEVVDIVKHYQRSLERCSGDEQRMLHCISKLCRLPVTVQHLQDTGVGRTVNALRKYEGDVGNAAKALVLKWKAMVAEAESSEEETPNNCERAKTESPPPKISASKNRSHNLEVQDSHKEHRTSEKSKTSSRSHSSGNNSVKVSSKNNQSKESHHSSSKRHIEEDSSESARKHKKRLVEVEVEDEEEGNDSGRDSHNENGDSDMSGNESDLNEDSQVNLMESDDMNGGIQNLNQNDDLSSGSEDKVKHKPHSTSPRERHQSSNSSYSRHSSHKHSAHSVKNHSSSSSNKEKSRRHESDNAEHKQKNSEKKSEGKNSVESGSKDNKNKNKDKRKEKDTVKHSEREKEKNREQKIEPSKLESSDKKKDSKSEKVHSKPDGKSSSKSSSSKSVTKPKSSSEKKNKSTENTEDGIDSFSGTSFADALGMMGMMDSVTTVKKKKKSNSLGTSSSKKSERTSENLPSTSKSSDIKSKLTSPKQPGKTSQEEINLLDPSVKLQPLDTFEMEMEMEVDVDATLPAITPNYRPLPHLNLDMHSRGRARTMTEEEALSQVMSTKNQRTKVYSGIKSGKSWATVPSLYDICVRVLQENIDALEYTGGVPYDLLKPVLTHATPDQLFVLEHYNPYLVEETDELWKSHVNRKFRNKSRLDMETYREMFQRCVEESEAKLKALTMNIQNSMAKAMAPVRQTKLAYVDSVAKPPRQVARKQAKYGTAHATQTTPLAKVQKLSSPVGSGSGSHSSVNHVPPPPRVSHSVAKTKPRVAPLMQKTLKFAKSFKR